MKRSIYLLSLVVVMTLCACAVPGTNESSPSSQNETPKPAVVEPLPLPVPASVPKSNESYSGTPSPQANLPAEPAKVTPEQLVQEGSALYDKGDYRGAIRKLITARDAADEGSSAKKASLRLLAFSYCVSNQRVLCRQQFSALLALEPTFQLSRAEAGHPLWGPVFIEAKSATAAAARKK
jgi:hypothetical protein